MKKYFAILNLEINAVEVIVQAENKEQAIQKVINNKKYWKYFIDPDDEYGAENIKDFLTTTQMHLVDIYEVVLVE